MKPFILIIEDDPDIAESIRYNLEREGAFQAQVALSGEEGLNVALGKGKFGVLVKTARLRLTCSFST